MNPLLHIAHAWGNPQGSVVVVLHGFLGTGEEWTAVFPVSSSYRFLAIDLPGHGGSTNLPLWAYTQEGMAYLLWKTLDALGISSVSFVGYSMGGRVALSASLQQPGRVNALLLTSASFGISSPTERLSRVQRDRDWAAQIRTHWNAFLHRWYRQPVFASLHKRPELLQRVIALRSRQVPAEMARVVVCASPGRSPYLLPSLQKLPIPMGYIVGTEDKKYSALGQRVHGYLPNVHLQLVRGAGHMVHLECPEEYYNWVCSLLNNMLQ